MLIVVRHLFPCGDQLLRSDLENFWFEQLNWQTTDTRIVLTLILIEIILTWNIYSVRGWNGSTGTVRFFACSRVPTEREGEEERSEAEGTLRSRTLEWIKKTSSVNHRRQVRMGKGRQERMFQRTKDRGGVCPRSCVLSIPKAGTCDRSGAAEQNLLWVATARITENRVCLLHKYCITTSFEAERKEGKERKNACLTHDRVWVAEVLWTNRTENETERNSLNKDLELAPPIEEMWHKEARRRNWNRKYKHAQLIKTGSIFNFSIWLLSVLSQELSRIEIEKWWKRCSNELDRERMKLRLQTSLWYQWLLRLLAICTMFFQWFDRILLKLI